MSYIYNMYKTEWRVKDKIDNANLLLSQHRLKLEWNQMVWSVNNLRCGTAGSNGHPEVSTRRIVTSELPTNHELAHPFVGGWGLQSSLASPVHASRQVCESEVEVYPGNSEVVFGGDLHLAWRIRCVGMPEER